MDFCPYALREVSVLTESTFGHLRYSFEGVPPQSNSPSSHVLERAVKTGNIKSKKKESSPPLLLPRLLLIPGESRQKLFGKEKFRVTSFKGIASSKRSFNRLKIILELLLYLLPPELLPERWVPLNKPLRVQIPHY